MSWQGNGMGTALERHAMCESALTRFFNSTFMVKFNHNTGLNHFRGLGFGVVKKQCEGL
jgi:hypothetical protein